MCDSIVMVTPQGVWLAKNSDREPGEAQSVEWKPAGYPTGSRHARRRCTHVEVEDRVPRRALVMSRPSWMWGAEMGVNERGLAIANEAVFTRMPVAAAGLTGMDLLRLALERADTAREGVDVITGLLRRYPQGGRMGHRSRGFRYHSSFLLADAEEAWLLETAGWLWAARRLQGRYASSNVLGIGHDHDLLHPEAAVVARARGWWSGRGDLDFARAFGAPLMAVATGGRARRACSHRLVSQEGDPFAVLAAALRDHGAEGDEPGHPADGWRMRMPCAHASWLPTRTAGQTTGSMIVRAGAEPRVWMTGTSSPCLSVFKPVAVDRDGLGGRGRAGERPDDGLWWSHERLHRRVLEDYAAREPVGGAERAELEARGRDEALESSRFAALWDEHLAQLPQWHARTLHHGRPVRVGPFSWFWQRQSKADALR
ncbi:C69 family dipeptidase [Paraliomyxa miuraensis]|uniref:C69 family dipeptidase n=1 Tax=Paraliomyxa miuraensis TaxID=376150 RepID=UPI0022514F9B|nr:C69 family dipeptidase [Paraliomyxa miuraensis]MCX4243936.1 C69 family dipeptidase [Paraliomyxa miuraensis]